MTTSPDRPLAGQHALVIGGSSGIGYASAHLLARDGARVTISGRTRASLEDATARLADDHGVAVEWTLCDGMDAGSVRAAVDAASDADRGLHIAVAVPGGGSISPVLCYGDDAFSAEIDQNVRPVFLALKYAGRAMVRAGGGSFVAISSTAAVFSSRYLAAYCAAKAAVDQLVKVAADELGEYGVRVNSVQPGLTHTGATDRMFGNDAMLADFLAGQALPRHGQPPDIAGAVRYFAGPESSWTTGQALSVDGGHTLRAFIDYTDHLDLPDQGEVARADG